MTIDESNRINPHDTAALIEQTRSETLAEVVRSVRHLIREEGYSCGEAEHILVHLKEMK